MENIFNRTALDPDHSVVIEACAGSGKTWLLVSRMVRLLLAGVPPSEILAITFTRKAAQEMAQRLRDWLRYLALEPDENVRQFLRERAVADGEVEALLPVARSLFETALTAQPSITINTFHGWFLQLIQRAPLSAGAAGNVNLLEQTSALLEEAWQRFAQDLPGNPDSDIVHDFDFLLRELGLASTKSLLINFVNKRAEWWAYTARRQDALGFAAESLRQELQVNPEADVLAPLFADTAFAANLRAYAELLEQNTATDKALSTQLLAALEMTDLAQCFEQTFPVFFTKTKPQPRDRNASAALAKRLGEAGQARFLQLHRVVCEQLQIAADALTEQAVYRVNLAGLRCGQALLAHYQRLKDEQQAIDFTDVEWRVSRLLNNSDHAEYMQYKLDSRYRHILLDEFQDTNPLQWQVLRAWLEASSAADSRPTVFLVGDPKQSIYRFRRAEARLFEIAADFFEHDFGARRLSQNITRRNAPAVLQAINEVFSHDAEIANFTLHESHHRELPGRVEVLPLVDADSTDNTQLLPTALRNPLQQPLSTQEESRHEVEARLLADKIHALIGTWKLTDEHGRARPAAYRDIMILVRSRTHLAIYEQALKAAQIPFVSSRQGGLLDTLEADDLLALLEFLITPFADLRLAQVLRSPLFACTDADLMLLAQQGEGPWWQRLRHMAGSGPVSVALLRAHTMLQSWQAETDRLPVHDLLDRIYFEGDLMRRYQAAVPDALRAGVAANLQTFMELALNVESGRYPSLPRFFNELTELRRATSQEAPDEGLIGEVGDALHIHTVHGAKGLEAPIVWLLNANAADKHNDSYGVLLDWPPQDAAPAHFSLYTTKQARGKQRSRYFDAEEMHARREDANLLYVAMTRARQVLIVSGCINSKATDASSWYQKIAQALERLGEVGTLGDNLLLDSASASPQRPLMHAVPDVIELTHPLPTGSREAGPVSAARHYGVNLHAVLEHIAPPQPMPDKVTLQTLLRLTDEAFAPLWHDATQLINAAHLRRFYDPSQYVRAYNELPYCTESGEIRRIDRLVEFSDSVWVLDYKTRESVPPENLAQAAAPYRSQLREYRAAMQQAYPDKAVHCALVFADARLYQIEQ